MQLQRELPDISSDSRCAAEGQRLNSAEDFDQDSHCTHQCFLQQIGFGCNQAMLLKGGIQSLRENLLRAGFRQETIDAPLI